VETRFRDYGEHGHPRRVERGEKVEDREYDAVGNPVFGTGSALLPGAGDTGVVSRRFDADRNLAAVELAAFDLQQAPAAPRILSIARRSDGQPVRIDRPDGGDSVFEYDAIGRPIERRDYADGAWWTTRFEWDLLSRQVATERPNGMRTEVAWDEAGRQRSLSHRRGAATDARADFHWESGRLAGIVDTAHGRAPEGYAYDGAGRVSGVRFPDGERLELDYDVRSRVVRERYVGPHGGELRRLQFVYDLADRELQVRDGATPLRTLRIAAGRVEEERLANGLVRTYAYSSQDGLVKSIEMRDPAGSLVESSRFAQELPAVTWRFSTTTSGALAATTHERFGLGPIAPGEPGPRVHSYSTATAGPFGSTWAYDALGNVTRTVSASGPERTFHYDPTATRLRRIRNGNGVTRHAYAYDEAGFVVERDGEAIEWDGAGNALSVGSGARFRWDALGRLVSSTVDGRSQRRLFGGRGIGDASGAPVAIELGALVLDLLGNHRFRHRDFRGNVKLVSDASGRIVHHARHTPYGPDLATGAADPDAGFAGGSRAGGDLLRLGSRLYDPDAARFLAPDPIFQVVNQYAYADGNPIWYWDPDGRSAELATAIAVGAALGTACAGAIIGVPAVTIFAFAFAIGVVTPPNFLGIAAAGAVAGAIRYAGRVPGVGAIFGGFAAGQTMGGAIQSSFGDSGLWDRFGDRPGQPDFPKIRKEIELRADFGGASGGGGGGGGPGGGGTGGCSPTSLASSPPRVARPVVLALLGLQALLGGLHLARRRASGRRS
jgi:RHS repeat-associated protein